VRNENKILVIVPAYNEAGTVKKTLQELNSLPFQFDMVVINDGSTDSTAEEAEKECNNVINLPYNLGIGGAVQTGFQYARKNNYNIVVQVDGDGQHRPDQIQKLIETMEESGADVVIGSRFLDQTGYTSTQMRRLGISLFRVINSLVLKKRITDNTSGFRAYNRRAFNFLADWYPIDYPEPESVIILARNGFRIEETAITMRKRRTGISSISAYGSVNYMLKVMLAIFVDLFKATIKQKEG